VPNTHRLVFNQATVAIFADIVETTLNEAKRRGLTVALTDREARVYLSKRMLRAIELGERDIGALQGIALLPMLN
jgi:hypothetical protein